jgi:phosphatidylinositol alpha-mannosyltransferase
MPDHLRIGLVCPYSLSIPGGVQAQVMGMARELRRLGHEARVLGPCDGPPPAAFVTPLGNSLPLAANGSIAPLAPDLPAALRTMRVLDDEEFDVIHLHEPYSPGPALFAMLLHRAPTVATFHAAGTSASYRMIGKWLQTVLYRMDRKVVVSKDALSLVQDHLGGEYEVLFNGVEVRAIQSVPPFDRSRHPGPTVLFCGRHEERKGLRYLVEAVESLDTPMHVWIASDGPDTAELMQRTGGDARFEWLGRITDEEKFARLRAADVFCAPSLGGESFGVVLIEAMAAGTAVVASSIDGYQNVATHDRDAILVPPGDPAALAEALHLVTTDDVLAGRLREAGTAHAQEFAMAMLVDRYIEIYRELLGVSPDGDPAVAAPAPVH